MKIAIIIRRLNVRGGTQRQALYLARELKKLGHEVKVYTFLYSERDCYEDLLKDLDTVSLNDYPLTKKTKSRFLNYLNSFLSFLKENKCAKNLALLIDRDTDILNPHDQVSYRVSYYFKKHVKNIPSVWMMNDLPTKLGSFWREIQIKPDLKISPTKKFFWWLIDNYEINRFIKVQDAITVLDNFMSKRLVKKYYGIEAKVVRSGLDLEKFLYVKRTPLINRKAKIFLAGIFFVHRRFEDAILAVKMLTQKNYDLRVTIAGDYHNDLKYYQKLKDLVGNLGLKEKVAFLGKISDEELVRNYQTNDIFIFPSYLQSWGLVVFEAMACGLPVIVSKEAGASEVLADGDNALLVNPKKPEEIALAIENLINNQNLYLKLSRNGRKFVESNISWPKYASKMLNIFKVLGENKTSNII